MARPKVNLNSVADGYANKSRERIIEFIDPETGLGGLISFTRQDDNTLRVDVYRTDDGVTVVSGEPKDGFVFIDEGNPDDESVAVGPFATEAEAARAADGKTVVAQWSPRTYAKKAD